MNPTSKALFSLSILGGAMLAITGCAQAPAPSSGAAASRTVAPETGSAQGVNTHNSEPMPSGMTMRNNGLSSGTPMSNDPGSMPRTGSSQGLNSHNSEPMPRGMMMRNNGTTPGRPLEFAPGNAPQTGSSQGVNTHNSQPMPSGMVMPGSPPPASSY